jgi:hypothetical protein
LWNIVNQANYIQSVQKKYFFAATCKPIAAITRSDSSRHLVYSEIIFFSFLNEEERGGAGFCTTMGLTLMTKTRGIVRNYAE